MIYKIKKMIQKKNQKNYNKIMKMIKINLKKKLTI